MNGVLRFEHEGRRVLGIDTGLSAEAFARARLSSLVTEPGYIILLRGTGEPLVKLWRAGGTVEMAVDGRPAPVMVVWGPDFAGLSLDELITREGGGNGIAALNAWARARPALPAEDRPPPWPGAALVDEGAAAVLFFPETAARRMFDAAGGPAWINGAERWTHPDYSGEEAEVFTAAALLYFALSGRLPYPARDADTLREDIREGVFIPPRMAAPGLCDEAAGIITAALSPRVNLKDRRPAFADLARLIGAAARPDGRRGLFRDITPAEAEALRAERERFLQKRAKAVKTGRFLRRNRTALLAVTGAAVIAALVAGSLIRTRLNRPSTRGMEGIEVVESYYNAITALDHEMMEACVTGGAGKDDINLVTNFFVISRVRQAYETRIVFISPQEWRTDGGGLTDKAVFGIDGLRLEGTDTDGADGRLAYRAGYRFFSPVPGDTAESETLPSALPAVILRQDELVLEKDRKGLWRISEIRRAIISPPATD
jgi:hypothetical protein